MRMHMWMCMRLVRYVFGHCIHAHMRMPCTHGMRMPIDMHIQSALAPMCERETWPRGATGIRFAGDPSRDRHHEDEP